MAKDFYFSIQSWMLEQIDLPLSDIAVFAYIYGLSNASTREIKGWKGSKRQLAKNLHVSPSTMNDIINRLVQRALVRIDNGVISSTIHRGLPTDPPAKPKERFVFHGADSPDPNPAETSDVQNPDNFGEN